ncbi:MAG: helix-turn-helix transcriptional regulator [Erythrobacter sp.]|uniref:helix-turn-helix domain-containing protein n=1 Tax=Erythrobacter sp. TaxID=1042 RepID=UPI003C77C883
MSLATRLHQLRVANRLSLQQVADKVGVSKAHVWNLEKGLTDNPSMELVVKLADLFRVRVADLVGENPEAADEDPEMVAMFRDLKRLGEDDREIIKGLMDQLRLRRARDDSQ